MKNDKYDNKDIIIANNTRILNFDIKLEFKDNPSDDIMRLGRNTTFDKLEMYFNIFRGKTGLLIGYHAHRIPTIDIKVTLTIAKNAVYMIDSTPD